MTALRLPERQLVGFTAAAAALVTICAMTGLAIAVSPKMGAVAVLGAAFGSLFFFGLSPTRVFLQALIVLLVAYAFLERGVAYVGVAPLYIGEMVLGLATIQIFVAFVKVRLHLIHWLLLGFMLFGLWRTLPYIGIFGIDALRDSVLWGYAVFAFAVSFTIQRHHMERVHAAVQRWLPWIIALGAMSYVIYAAFGPSLPRAPGSDVPIIAVRAGELAVHLAGMAAFLLLGLYSTDAAGSKQKSVADRGETLLYGAVIFGLLALGAFSRGAFLTIVVAMFAAFLFRPSMRIVRLGAAGLLVLPFLVLFAPDVKLGSREFSVKQVADNVTSIFAPEQGTQLQGTRSFREDWWEKIIGYTVHGEYFWTGKGFGVNLADDDGFQVLEDKSLRSPHNGHMNILARMGVPGITIWLSIFAAFGVGMLRARHLYLQRGDTLFAGLTAWILVYWLAAATNASFDVYIEGPQGGIWFWCLLGCGIGLMTLAEQQEDEDNAAQPRTGVLAPGGASL